MKRIVLRIAAVTTMSGCMMFMKPPGTPEAYEQTQASATQLYRATYTPMESITVGKLHKWSIEIVNADGTPVDSATITVDGGMPQHGHGLPTSPAVVAHLGNGKHLVDGMKFNMGGWWVVRLTVDGAKGSDVVTFNLKL